MLEYTRRLIGFSGVVNIVTFTEVSAKNGGGKGTASSEAMVNVVVKYAPTGTSDICTSSDSSIMTAAPGIVTFASRKQELSVEVDLEIICADDADDGCQLTADDLEIDGEVTVGLGLDTTAAHHFNFVAPNLPVGEFDVMACYTGSGETSLTDGFDGDATAYLAIHSRMLTVQQVKAVNSGTVDSGV